MSWTKDFDWDLMLITFLDSHKWENIKEDNSLFFIELRKESLEPKYKSSKLRTLSYIPYLLLWNSVSIGTDMINGNKK